MLVLAAAAVLERPALADETSEPLRVEITGDTGCVDGAGFFAAIHARTAKVREATHEPAGEPAAVRVRVRLRRTARGETGSLTLVDAHGHESAARTVRADTCAEAVDALALVAALSIDPGAAAASAAAAGAPAAKADASDALEALDAEKLPPSVPAGPDAMAAPTLRATASAPSSRGAGSRWAWSAGGGLEAVSAIGGLDPAPEVFVDLSSSRAGLLSPSFRLAGRYVTGTTSGGGDDVRFSWWMGELDACPLHIAPLGLRGCADVELGEILASPHAAALNDRGQPWVAAGLRARARVWEGVTAPFFVDLDLGLDAAITRQKFVIEPATAVYQAPVVVGHGGIDLGVRFP